MLKLGQEKGNVCTMLMLVFKSGYGPLHSPLHRLFFALPFIRLPLPPLYTPRKCFGALLLPPCQHPGVKIEITWGGIKKNKTSMQSITVVV